MMIFSANICLQNRIVPFEFQNLLFANSNIDSKNVLLKLQ